MSDPVVKLEQGSLLGKLCSAPNVQYYAFKGIPYAKPPLGDLRFAAPQPPEPWEGIWDATKNCNICMQFDTTKNIMAGSEDCLYLNVYTPKLPKENEALLPVMVYFHGGGFIFGSGTDDTSHGPDFIVSKDVVTVSFNYRLGIFGFFSLDCKDATGNMGLRDQVQALRWVQQNISKFSGDPNNVTIFGISAGGASVEYLLMSPMAKGLFHKAISQSGSSLLHWAHNRAVNALSCNVAMLSGAPMSDEQETLKYLKSLSATKLITFAMMALLSDKYRGGIHFGFVPTVEQPGDWDPFLDKCPYDVLSAGEFTKVPYISGFCSREGLLMVSSGPVILDGLVRSKDFVKLLPFDIDDTDQSAMNNKLLNIYMEPDQYDERDSFAINFFTDVDFLGGIYTATSLIAKHNSPVYFYEFAYDGQLNYIKRKLGIDRKGACHGDDGGYLIKSQILPENVREIDKLVRDRVVTMWTDFAKFGDPTPAVSKLIPVKWEPVAETGLTCLHIDTKLTMKHDIYRKRMKLFKELYEKSQSLV